MFLELIRTEAELSASLGILESLCSFETALCAFVSRGGCEVFDLEAQRCLARLEGHGSQFYVQLGAADEALVAATAHRRAESLGPMAWPVSVTEPLAWSGGQGWWCG